MGAPLPLTVLFSIIWTTTADCSLETARTEFSDCRDGRRTAYWYWEAGECVGKDTLTVTGLDCELECPPGEVLGFDGLQSVCEQCPSGTYSLGGAMEVPGAEFTWDKVATEMWSGCKLANILGTELHEPCTGWKADLSNSEVRSGTSDSSMVWVHSSLVLFPRLLHPGELFLRYHKETVLSLAFIPNGVFSLYVNNDRVLFDETVEDGARWKNATVSVGEGLKEVRVEYEYFQTSHKHKKTAAVGYLRLSGVQHSAKECSVCTSGYSNPGSDGCSLCAPNTILSSFPPQCLPCPPDSYSLPPQSQCTVRLPCSSSDYSYQFTPCTNLTRSKVYTWNHPFICNHRTGVPLPDLEPALPCEPCPPGMYHSTTTTGEDRCSYCPEGTALIEAVVGEQCRPCPAGTQATKLVNETQWDRAMDSTWKSYCTNRVLGNCGKTRLWKGTTDWVGYVTP